MHTFTVNENEHVLESRYLGTFWCVYIMAIEIIATARVVEYDESQCWWFMDSYDLVLGKASDLDDYSLTNT